MDEQDLFPVQAWYYSDLVVVRGAVSLISDLRLSESNKSACSWQVDIYVPTPHNKRIAIEVDGPFHFPVNVERMGNSAGLGHTIFR